MNKREESGQRATIVATCPISIQSFLIIKVAKQFGKGR